VKLRALLPPAITGLALRVREAAFLAKQRRRLVRIAAYRRPWPDTAALLAAVQRKQLVFTITAGRTGTVYLQKLLGLFPDTTSLHEPEPAYVSVLRSVQHRPALAREFLLEYKLPFIAGVATTRYVEASHLFCKGFLEPALELGLRPRFVALRRSPRRIASSYLARAVPAHTKYGRKYLLHPGDPGVLPLPDWPRYSDYQLCFWYALEIERRQRDYARLLAARGLTCVDVTAEELHDGERFLHMAAALGLVDETTDRAALRRAHAELSVITHNPNRRPAPLPADLDAEEEAVWEAVAPHAGELRALVRARYARDADQGGRSA
jgi:hypothetical protein